MGRGIEKPGLTKRKLRKCGRPPIRKPVCPQSSAHGAGFSGISMKSFMLLLQNCDTLFQARLKQQDFYSSQGRWRVIISRWKRTRRFASGSLRR